MTIRHSILAVLACSTALVLGQASAADKAETSMLQRMARSGVTVTSTDFLGAENGNVLSNESSMNEDLVILQRRQKLAHELKTAGRSLDEETLIGLSGEIEGGLVERDSWQTGWQGEAELSSAEFDIGVMVNSWVDAFISMLYNASATETGARVPTNDLYLKRGFMTIGNLDETPFYLSVGQMYVPFGRYSSAMLTTPMTKSMGRISARAMLLGYSSGPIFSQIYGYNSLSQSNSNSPVNEGGVNLGASFETGKSKWDVILGWVTNISDSQGGLNNVLASSGFKGFDAAGTSFELQHNVAGGDAYIRYSRGDWRLSTEYLTGLRHYDPADMYFGSTTRGAKPSAWQSEIDYSTTFMGKPATASLVYGRTWEAVPMNLPKHSYAFVYDVQMWKWTLIGIEFRHDENYKAGTAGGGATSTGVQSVSPVCEGGSRDIVTMRIAVYF